MFRFQQKIMHIKVPAPRKNSGIVLIVVIFTMMLFSILIITVVNMQSKDFDTNLRTFDSERALFIAESGAQWALNQLNQDLNWRTDSAHGYENGYAEHILGAGQYEVICREPSHSENGNAVIISTGYVPRKNNYKGKRVLKLLVTTGLGFNYAVYAGQSVTLTGAKIDSYNSSDGPYNQFGNRWNNGNVGTNGDITASGDTYIYGNASTSPLGWFNDTSYVWGTITHDNNYTLPTISVPASLVGLISSGTLNKTETISSGDYKYSSIDLASDKILTINGPANIYLTGNPSIKMAGESQIIISPSSTGAVKIYADNDVSISGQGVINSTSLPKNFILYCSTSGNLDISITGQGDFYGGIIAPTANINISGQGNLFGSFIGKTVNMSGQAFVHYDESMKTLPVFDKKISVTSWKEE